VISSPKQQSPQFSVSPGTNGCAAVTAADLPEYELSQQMLVGSIKTNEEQHKIHNPLCKTVSFLLVLRY